MKLLVVLLLCQVLTQTLVGSTPDEDYHESSEADRRLATTCGAYTHKVMKPMLEYFHQMKQKIDQSEHEMEIKNSQLRQLQEKVIKLQLENSNHKSREDSDKAVLGELGNIRNIMEQQMNNNCEKQIKEISQLRAKALADTQKLTEYQSEIKKITEVESVKRKTSCIPFGNSSGIEELSLSRDYTLKVLCNSKIAGPGWTVIQQRIDGRESFDRNWTTYRNGFGSFEGDFFLGLENIYRLTSEQPHELYIQMGRFDGSSYYARYDRFALTGEDDQYRLSKLGKFSGNTSDLLHHHMNSRFSTFDRNNNHHNCLKYFTGGWWYNQCADCNLNGKYLGKAVDEVRSVHWERRTALKFVQMLIRPLSK